MPSSMLRAITACLLGSAVLGAAHAQSPQDDLEISLNDGYEVDSALEFEWPMISIGTAQYEDGPTGVTVFRFGRKVDVAIDARGGGPGTVNAEYLHLGYETPELDAVVFAGGSWFGLEAVTAVNTALKDDGVRSGHWDNLGLAVGSIIYDFGGRRLNEIYPDKRLAQAALRAAQPGTYPRGAYGAGRSARNGSAFGCSAKSGQGGSFRQIGDVKVAAFVVVNAIGVVVDRDGSVVACQRGDEWPDDLKVADLMAQLPGSMQPDWTWQQGDRPEPKNTTISMIVTNQALPPSELQRLAVQVHTSMGRGIQPFATRNDGDVLYAVSTAEIDAEAEGALSSLELGVIGSEIMWDAILSAVPEQPARVTALQGDGPTDRELRRLTGTYRFSEHVSVRVEMADGRLVAQAEGEVPAFLIPLDAPIELVPAEGGVFIVGDRYQTIVAFDRNRLTLNPGRWQQVATRTGR